MVNDFGQEMKDYVRDIQEILETDEQRLYFLERTSKLFDIVEAKMNEIFHFKEEQIAAIEKKQEEEEQRLEEMSQKIRNIHNDIYEETEEFEIVCPYCNCEFDIEVDENTLEVNCPECNNIIELDWNNNPDELK